MVTLFTPCDQGRHDHGFPQAGKGLALNDVTRYPEYLAPAPVEHT